MSFFFRVGCFFFARFFWVVKEFVFVYSKEIFFSKGFSFFFSQEMFFQEF